MMIYSKPMFAFVALGATLVSGFTSSDETTATVAAIETGECTVSADCADTVAGEPVSERMAPEGGANYCCCEGDAVATYTCDDCRGCVADNNDVSGEECPAKCSEVEEEDEVEEPPQTEEDDCEHSDNCGEGQYCCCFGDKDESPPVKYTCDECAGCIANKDDVSGAGYQNCPAKCSPSMGPSQA